MELMQQRRRLLIAGAALGGLALLPPLAIAARPAAFEKRLAALEKQAKGRIGLALLNSGSGETRCWRADERFMLCSTFKLLLAAAVLRRSEREPGLLTQQLRWREADRLSYMPVTEKHPQGMTVAELCAAAVCYSDNVAANLLLRLLGGPAAVTALARDLGDNVTRLDRSEPQLNTLTRDPMLDSTTPQAMANTVRQLVLGGALAAPQRQQLIGWLRDNTTGDKAIRAAVPAGWLVGDKTGSGEYGATNDVAAIWPPDGAAPLILTIYFIQRQADARSRQDVLAAAADIALHA